MTITDLLRGEHGVLTRLLEHVAGQSLRWSLRDALEAGGLLEAALASHAHLEDELLFRALEPYIAAQQGPLAVMRLEHAAIEGALERLRNAIDDDEARALLLYAAEVARDHFLEEERILFPLAERCLEPSRLAELGQAWSERRVLTVAA